MTLHPERTGYSGQRYQVDGLRRQNGEWSTIGWCEDSAGGSLAQGAELDPKFSEWRVVDLFAEAVEGEEEEAIEAPHPTGRCPGCGRPIYSTVGRCGVCNPLL